MKKWTVITLFVLVAMVLAACGPTGGRIGSAARGDHRSGRHDCARGD